MKMYRDPFSTIDWPSAVEFSGANDDNSKKLYESL